MMKWIPVTLALLLSACSSTSDTTYYQLPAGQQVAPRSESSAITVGNARPILWIEHVSVPDYLAGNGVVYQTNDVQYVIAANNLWASPLDQQLQQNLVTNLSSALPGWLISATPPTQPHDTLNVNVTGFHGRYDGKVIVSGEWTLEHNDQLTKQPFLVTLPQDADGYDAMVRTLAKGWQQEAQQMANALSRLN
ncbi:membrane integrity-associated transporter subunit PqiC [Paramixta manurensis]|uniref:Membrane integrity-associated transporter subunit PqiC n=1 Tax=Paramixta manurensis TaxID=2740817 RepID=A0A6M8UAC1_9GAMM|nr:membrane integrity-associated transporter subunit PqiC [Erwiniaceae bacterium PD-1]